MIFMNLEGAQIVECKGFNQHINPNLKFCIEMAEHGILNIYTTGVFGGKKAFWFAFHGLELRSWTNSIRTGGGFVGGRIWLDRRCNGYT